MITTICQWFVKLTGWIPQALIFRIRVHYEDRAVQDKRIRGKAIVISNHTDLMDFAVLMFVFWRRTLRCAVAELMYEKNFVMTLLLKALGTVRVNRTDHDFSFLGKCRQILDRGGVVEIFPEARLPEPDEERPLPFKPSAVYLALESGAPIIPVYNSGEHFANKPLHVVIGTPIDVRALYNDALSEKENIAHITEYLRGKVIELGKTIEPNAPQTEEKEECVRV